MRSYMRRSWAAHGAPSTNASNSASLPCAHPGTSSSHAPDAQVPALGTRKAGVEVGRDVAEERGLPDQSHHARLASPDELAFVEP